jgi:tetratricopeptide (TPR) repeat protein
VNLGLRELKRVIRDRGRDRGRAMRCLAQALCWLAIALPAAGASPTAAFRIGVGAYNAGDYNRAIKSFSESAMLEPASGTFQNLGNAEWKLGHTGPAVLAWERALWLDPLNHAAFNNLRFARKTAQLEAPDLAWYEVVSSWLPVNWWAWVASCSFWLAVALVLLPGIFRWRKLTWQQAVAAFGFAVFLLSLPAHFGVNTRSRIGFFLQKETPLRLTPTEEAQVVTRLPAGEPARLDRVHGGFALVHTSRAMGWVRRGELGLISRAANL